MKEYEVVYIFDSMLAEDDISGKLDRFHTLVTGDGGEITAVDHWGKRQFAYPIGKKEAGSYVVVQLTAAPDALPEFERALKLDDDVLRYLIVVNEGLPTSAMSIATREPSDRDDDEDRDEDEED